MQNHTKPYNTKPWKTNLESWKTMKTDLEPWKTNLEPWKPTLNHEKPWKTNLEPQKTMKTYLEPWKTNLELWKTMKNQPGNMKNQPGTMKNHENRPGTMNNQPGTMNTHENRPGTINKQKRYKQTDRQNLPIIYRWYVRVQLLLFPPLHSSPGSRLRMVTHNSARASAMISPLRRERTTTAAMPVVRPETWRRLIHAPRAEGLTTSCPVCRRGRMNQRRPPMPWSHQARLRPTETRRRLTFQPCSLQLTT